ncbi:MAG: lysophospholipase [Microbacteriaceae bacterium]|jgi:pimeloyl-ACP methyl ester carboxylesterase|nr:lysophospholipase [Microbacteriaceae bacterium]
MTQTTTSADGTTIAYEKNGSGPAIIVIGGAFNTRQSAADIAGLLAAHFSVYTYDRRGRGDSRDASASAGGSVASDADLIARELEDLAAVIAAAGGSAALYGHSSGAAIALEAAASGLPVTKLATYEPPLVTPDPSVGSAEEWRASIRAAVEADDRDRAARLFLQGTGLPLPAMEFMVQQPWWPGMLSVAHTLPSDVAMLGDGTVPAERYAAITVPTLAVSGSDSAWATDVTTRLGEVIPGAKTVIIQAQGHDVDAATLAPVLTDFFL